MFFWYWIPDICRRQIQVRFADFAAVKVLDRASPNIYEACCKGRLIKDVVVELWWACEPRLHDERRLGVGSLFPRPANADDRNITYLTIRMDDVIIIRVRAGSSCQEAVSFCCAKVVWTYTREGADGVAANNVTFEWKFPGGRATDWGTAASRSMVSCTP